MASIMATRDAKAFLMLSPEDRKQIWLLGKDRGGNVAFQVFAHTIGKSSKRPDNDEQASMVYDDLISKYESGLVDYHDRQSANWQKNWKRWHKGQPYPGDEAYFEMYHGSATVMQQQCSSNHSAILSDTESESSTISLSRYDQESGSVCEFNPTKIDEEEMRYGCKGIVQILGEELGRGFWQAAVDQLGEETVREEFLTFCAEYRAGETVQKPAAAFTARLKKLGATAKGNKEVGHA